LRLRGADMSYAVNRNTDFVIAGFGGSANSYATAFFISGQRNKHLAHHLHAPAQVMRATHWQIPCLVLVRHPIDAISSLASRGHVDHSVRGLTHAMRAYSIYYKSVTPLMESFIASEFNEVTEDFSAVLARVNTRFQTSFVAPDKTAEGLEQAVKIPTMPRRGRVSPVADIRKKLWEEKEFEQGRNTAIQTYNDFCMAARVRTSENRARRPKAPKP